jgi:polyisoprenoid-binding protein YceI
MQPQRIWFRPGRSLVCGFSPVKNGEAGLGIFMTKVKARSFGTAVSLSICLAIFLSAAATPPRVQSPAPASAWETALTLDPAQSKVHYTVDSSLHTVHGTFNLKSGSIHFDPSTGKAGGEIVVFATSGESGNDGRDKRMHKEILETAKYPEVIFHPTHVEGKVAASGPSDVKVHGMFSIHGTDHELTALVHAELAGDHWTGTGKFEVPYVTWGIKDPSNFFLKVKHVVNVELEMSGATKTRETTP